MDDLDKVARELLARQYDCDMPGSVVAKKLLGEFDGQLRVADLVGLAAIRAALLTAPPGYVLAPVEPTRQMLDACAWDEEWMFESVWRKMIDSAPEVK